MNQPKFGDILKKGIDVDELSVDDDVMKEYLDPNNKNYFLPTPEWNDSNSSDFLWSGRTTGGTEITRPTETY